VCGKGPDICRASAAERILARLTGSAPIRQLLATAECPLEAAEIRDGCGLTAQFAWAHSCRNSALFARTTRVGERGFISCRQA
jgi:hypothetical protein